MKKPLADVTKHLVAAMLVIALVVGVSALTMHAPVQNQNSVARSLKSIQTDKATSFYAYFVPTGNWFVEQVLPGTSESKAATENLKSIAAAL
jgi:site-specific recombinase